MTINPICADAKPVASFGRFGQVFKCKDGRTIFTKSVNRPEHFMRRNQSWAISCDLVKDLNKLGVGIIILDVRNEGFYQTDMATFNRHSTIERWGNFEEQAFLHESWWDRVVEGEQ